MDSEQNKSYTSDRWIIREVLQGRAQEFTRLVDRYKGPVFNLALRMTGNHQDAEDLAQETFLKAYLGLKGFQPQRRFFPWLFTVAVNTVRNHLKKKPSAPVVHLDAGRQEMVSGPQGNPETQLAEKQKKERIDAALQHLSIEQREAVVLRYYQDLPFDDIAAVCDVPVSTAKMRVYRGIQRLSLILDEKVQKDIQKNESETLNK